MHYNTYLFNSSNVIYNARPTHHVLILRMCNQFLYLREERHFGMFRLVVKYMDANVKLEPIGSKFGSQ